MSAEIATDYTCAERVALALVPLRGLAAVLLGGVGDDWLRSPVYPYAVIRPESAEQPRGGVTRTIRARLVVRAADAASKPDPQAVGHTDWTFADGLLEAAQENLAKFLPILASNSHLEIAIFPAYNDLYLVMDGHAYADGDAYARGFASVTISADGLSAIMDAAADWALAVVPIGSAVATRTARTLLRVGAGPELDALVQAARDALSTAALGAPLESINTDYDEDAQFPVQSATLSITLADAQAFGDAF